jgi:hypothetical protein
MYVCMRLVLCMRCSVFPCRLAAGAKYHQTIGSGPVLVPRTFSEHHGLTGTINICYRQHINMCRTCFLNATRIYTYMHMYMQLRVQAEEVYCNSRPRWAWPPSSRSWAICWKGSRKPPRPPPQRLDELAPLSKRNTLLQK